MTPAPVLMTIAALVVLQPAASHADGDAERGMELYESRCGACHSLDANRVGPAHRGVFGRTAGTFDDYNYSDAVRTSGVVWDEASLDAWLTDPRAFIPGNKMGFRLSTPEDRADVIAYLKANPVLP